MSITSTLAAPTRRLLAGLIVTTIATASAGAWALTAGATGPTDEPTTIAATVEDVTVDRPAAIGVRSGARRHSADRRRRPLPRRRIHGLPNGTDRSSSPTPTTASDHGLPRRAQPIVVADPYPRPWIHGLPKRHRPDRRCRRLPRRRRHRVPVNPPGVQIGVAARPDPPRRQPSDTTADDPCVRPRPTGSTNACGRLRVTARDWPTSWRECNTVGGAFTQTRPPGLPAVAVSIDRKGRVCEERDVLGCGSPRPGTRQAVALPGGTVRRGQLALRARSDRDQNGGSS